AVAMPVIERYAEIAALFQEQLGRPERQQRAIADFGERIFVTVMAVGIGEERERRGEEGDRRFRRVLRREDKERQEIFIETRTLAATAHARGIDAARQVAGNGPAEIGLPLHVVEIVAVNMDGAVKL